MMTALASAMILRHTFLVPQTAGTGFGDLDRQRRTHRHSAVFLRPYAVARFLWAGDCGDTFGYAGFLCHRFANPAFCPPTSFGDEARVHPTKEAAMRVSIPARPEQSNFLFTIQEADHAARAWFAQRKPSMTLAAWRDHFLSLHLSSIRAVAGQERARRAADWNHAFAAGVAAEIAGGAHHG